MAGARPPRRQRADGGSAQDGARPCRQRRRPPARRPAPNRANRRPAPVLFLAYSYAIGIELPARAALRAWSIAMSQACQSAGPRLCQLIGSNVSGDPESSMNGYVSLRGEPAWLGSFMARRRAQADAAGGRILQETTNTEDLTRAIVDSEARQRAQTTLRDRLQDLLRNRGRAGSPICLETERELARVQGEIDALQSSLAVMRTRVAMSELTLSYQSSPHRCAATPSARWAMRSRVSWASWFRALPRSS